MTREQSDPKLTARRGKQSGRPVILGDAVMGGRIPGKCRPGTPARAVGAEGKEEEAVAMEKEGQNPSKGGSHRRKGALLLAGALMLTGLFGVLAISK